MEKYSVLMETSHPKRRKEQKNGRSPNFHGSTAVVLGKDLVMFLILVIINRPYLKWSQTFVNNQSFWFPKPPSCPVLGKFDSRIWMW